MKRKTLSTILLVLIFVFGYHTTALAAAGTKYSETPTTGIKASDPTHGTSHQYRLPNNPLNSAQAEYVTPSLFTYSCDVYYEGSGLISGYAVTTSNADVDELGYTIMFEVWNGTDWVAFATAENSAYNTFHVDNFHYMSVESNKNYRISTVHYIIENGVKEIATSTSEYIYVD